MSAEAFQNIKENIELIPDEKKLMKRCTKNVLKYVRSATALLTVCAVNAVVLWR